MLDARRDGSEALAELAPERQSALLQAHFLFSVVWSVGANTDEEGRRRFDTAIRKLLAGDPPAELAAWVKAPAVKVAVPFPEGSALVYDYVLDRSRIKWVAKHGDVDAQAAMLMHGNAGSSVLKGVVAG